MYTAYALITHLESSDDELLFQDFKLSRIDTLGDRQDAIRALPGVDVSFGDWVYKRIYDDVPGPRNYSSVGRIPADTEDSLLLFRLFKVGDICFLKHSVETPDGRLLQRFPHRIMMDLISASPYPFRQSECARWDAFATELRNLPCWETEWFGVARRFFLFGGAKEFILGSEMDRIVDYVIALEAALVPESDFVGKRLRERAMRVTGRDKRFRNLIRDFYGFRSDIVHGSGIATGKLNRVGQGMLEFEQGVRDILVSALRGLPADRKSRERQLAEMYHASVGDRVREAIRYLRPIVAIG